MVVPVMKNSGEGFNIGFGFIKKMSVHQGDCCFLRIDKAWGLQKLGIILENKLPPNLRLENISIIEIKIKTYLKYLALCRSTKHSNFLEAHSFC